ncbi:MAG: OmpA family protein [Micromonosporaceae bacterium]
MPALLALLVLVFSGQSIENKLTTASGTALEKAGLGAVGVSFDGRDGTLTGVPEGREDEARSAVEEVDGVRVVGLGTAGNLDLALDGESIVVSGSVPDEATRTAVIEAAEAKAGGKKIVDELTVKDGALLPGNPAMVGPLVASMAPDQAGKRHLTWDNDGVKLTGEVPDEAAKTAVGEQVAEALPGIDVDNQLSAAKEELQAEIDAYLAANPLEFGKNSAKPTAQGEAIVEHVAGLLEQAPDVKLSVEGHVGMGPVKRTTSTPYQQKLSEERANAVKDALVAHGIAADRITARGFGIEGSNPGRRVDIKIQ